AGAEGGSAAAGLAGAGYGGAAGYGDEVFNATNARTLLNSLTAFGPRVTGSHANEVLVPAFLQKHLKALQRSLPKGTGESGNVGNVGDVGDVGVGDWSVLVNAHFDSIPGSPGGADDGVGVACMLEVLRVLTLGPPLTRPVLFLFNGAEESNHQAAHGFVTQHPWAQSVQYVLNLEAIGSGGQELVFQCNSGWLAKFY
ncbi:hypothetical protein B484DRAFT_397659, partial [Ochromonadaceae sp. CCMP2298]